MLCFLPSSLRAVGKSASGGWGQIGAIRDMTAENGKISAHRRLTSWKEIAAFLGRDERTAKRWEDTRGLPVRRVPGAGRSSVFAYTDEIEAWMSAGAPPAEPAADAEKSGLRLRPRQRVAALAALAILLVAVAGGLFVVGKNALFSAVRQDARSSDPVATDFYRSGLHAWQTRTPGGLARAIADFQRAVARDPHFAAAYAGLADAYNLEAEFTAIPPTNTYPRAADAAKRAIALDPSLSSAHAALAFADFYWSRNAPAAELEFRRALALDPANATAHHWYATFLMSMGRFDEALAQIDKAESLDSESSAIPADKALILFHAGKAAEAIRLLTQIEDEQPDFASPHRYLATIWRDDNRDQLYLRELKQGALARHDPIDAEISDAGAKGLASAGHYGMLRAVLDAQRRFYGSGKEPAYALALTSAKLGDTDDAIAYLSASVARHESDNVALAVDGPFAALRKDGRFLSLVARAGLSEPR
jgi:tetratricopeptide (TPR) repeat protein